MAKKDNTPKAPKQPKRVDNGKGLKGKFYEIEGRIFNPQKNVRILTSKEVFEHDDESTVDKEMLDKYKKKNKK